MNPEKVARAVLVAAAGATPQERAPIPATKPMRGYVQELVEGYGAALYTLKEAVDRITLLIAPAEGWSDEDRHEALSEARRRWSRPDTEWVKRHFDGCINGFALGAEWQKAKLPALVASVQVDEAQIAEVIERAERLAQLTAAEGSPIAEFGVSKDIAFVRGVRWALEYLRGGGR